MTEAEKQAETHRLVERSAEIERAIGCPHGRLHDAQRSFDRIARGLRRPEEIEPPSSLVSRPAGVDINFDTI